MYVYCTSKSGGPDYSTPSSNRIVYLGTSLTEAELAVGDFSKYQREDFPTRFVEAYSALPKSSIDWEMLQYYAADGWWISVVRFELTPTEEEEPIETLTLKGDGQTVSVIGNIPAELPPEPYPDEDAKNDMANVVAQFTSGVKGAIPEQEDFFLADRLLVMIALVLKKD